MPPLVSVIIPAYNSATRIKACLDSIIAQDYDSIEIIVVDDASHDDTGKIAREILSASTRPHKVITHSRNKGECAARNTGLENSSGEYVVFVDSDDMTDSRFISRLSSLITESGYDASFCGRADRFSDGQPDIPKPIKLKPPYFRTGEEMLYLRLNDVAAPHMCTVMMRREFLDANGLRWFNGTCWAGDVEFQLKVFACCDHVAFTEECLYVYMHHPEMGSVSGNDTREKRIIRYEANTLSGERLADFLASKFPEGRINSFVRKIIIPQNIIRRFTLSAMKIDRVGYDSLRENVAAMKDLRQALSFFTMRRKPEVFAKAALILFAPGIYYRMRAE